MALHYKRDGTLDMRYTSSRNVVAASNSYAAPSYSGRASYGSASQLHVKKDGTLDMRYTSSRDAVASAGLYQNAAPRSSYVGASSSGARSVTPAPAPAPQLHFKKDGTLDMRYSSSQAAVTSGLYASSSGEALHFKKDGTLDMRYKSSQTAAATPVSPKASAVSTAAAGMSSGQVHFKKDGSLDMRYKSSQEIAKRLEKLDMSSSSHHGKDTNNSSNAATKQHRVMGVGIPSYVPVTSTGRPDLRTRAAKDWVTLQAQAWNDATPLPPWIPRLKDGSPDTTKSVTRTFFSNATAPPEPRREEYYAQRLLDEMYEELIRMERAQPVALVEEPEQLQDTAAMRAALNKMNHAPASAPAVATTEQPESEQQQQQQQQQAAAAPSFDTDVLPASVQQLEFSRDLVIDDSVAPLGHGSFGVVVRGLWGDKQVAVKKLHAAQLTKRDKQAFIKETLVLGVLGSHPNIVQLYGYTLSPVAIVMEFMGRGSLSYVLHYCEDPQVEAKITDGRVKLNLLLGIAFGMAQLHACGVTHGDLKPQNVLVSDDFQAKIADFGLATLRVKTSSLTSSHVLSGATLSGAAAGGDTDGGADLEGVACGTAAYMAPELLSLRVTASEKTDVYSFGILMNELLQEEEPYYQSLRMFVGKGPYAAALAAQSGQRPVVHDARVTPQLRELIEQCWSARAAARPSFEQIGRALGACSGVPHSCG